MFDWYKFDMVKPIDKNSKILIGLGDGFVNGHGACSNELWEKCNWDLNNVTHDNIKEYQMSFYKNSWVHKICENYMTEYIPINMGITGVGNRGAVKELYLHPELNIESAAEKVVVFMLSDFEKFDFIHREYFEHIHFETIQPMLNQSTSKRELWDSFTKHAYSDRGGLIETLLAIAEAKTWCKAHNATLLLTSSTRYEYNHDYFVKTILEDCECDKGRTPNYLLDRPTYVGTIANFISWEDFFRPAGHHCLTDYLLELENKDILMNTKYSEKYYDYSYGLEKLSENGYITNSSYPSENGHEKIANIISNHITHLKNKKPIKNKKK